MLLNKDLNLSAWLSHSQSLSLLSVDSDGNPCLSPRCCKLSPCAHMHLAWASLSQCFNPQTSCMCFKSQVKHCLFLKVILVSGFKLISFGTIIITIFMYRYHMTTCECGHVGGKAIIYGCQRTSSEILFSPSTIDFKIVGQIPYPPSYLALASKTHIRLLQCIQSLWLFLQYFSVPHPFPPLSWPVFIFF